MLSDGKKRVKKEKDQLDQTTLSMHVAPCIPFVYAREKRSGSGGGVMMELKNLQFGLYKHVGASVVYSIQKVSIWRKSAIQIYNPFYTGIFPTDICCHDGSTSKW